MLLKSIFSITMLLVLTACQHLPTTSATSTELQSSIEQAVAPCENGFDDVNVCHLLS